MKVDIIKIDGKKAGNISLKDHVFNIEPREDIMSRVVNWQLSKRRIGSHSVLSRSQISLTKSKAFKQKEQAELGVVLIVLFNFVVAGSCTDQLLEVIVIN